MKMTVKATISTANDTDLSLTIAGKSGKIFITFVSKLIVKGRIILFAFLLSIFLMLAPVFALENFKVALIEHVDGYGKFIPKSGNYQIGDTVKIYAHVKEINHKRAYAVDFVFVIYDPDDYPVAGTVISKKGADWTDKTYAVYQFEIPDGWKTGEYRAEVYAFDVLNSTATYNNYKSFFDNLIENGEAKITVSSIPRDEVDYKKKEVRFRVVHDVKPEIVLFDSGLKAAVLPEGMNNTLQVSIFNKGNEKAGFYLNFLIDGKFFSKKWVEIEPHGSTRVEFNVPQLEVGDHSLVLIPEWDNHFNEKFPPIYVEPYYFNRPLMIASIGNGSIILSLNDYILGSGGAVNSDEKNVKIDMEKEYDMNRDSAAKTLTNVIAYAWNNINHSNVIRIGLYYKSDLRADGLLRDLVDYIKKLNRAPIEYAGVISDYELERVDLLVYVSGSPDLERVIGFAENGRVLFVDVSDYYYDSSSVVSRYHLKEARELEKTFYDFSSINKTVSIRLKTELRLPPELKYSNLSISDFIVDVGKPVRISFDVVNKGGAGIEKVFVKINEILVFNETVKIFQGERKHFEFEYIPEKEGSYKVVLDDTGISKVFFAKNVTKNAVVAPTPAEKKPVKRDPTLITILAGILAFLIIVRMYLRR